MERFARENGSLHSEIIQRLILDDAKIITVTRNGKQFDVPFTEKVKRAVLAKTPLFSPNIPFVIDAFAESSVMEKAGAQVGDRIIKINDMPMVFAGDVIAYTPSLKGDSAKVVVDRNGQELLFHLFLEEGVMGVQLQPFLNYMTWRENSIMC